MSDIEDASPVETPAPGAMSRGLRAWRARLTGPTARKGAVAVVDQAVVSGTNFVTAFLLARLCTKEEFGAYVLAFSVMLFLNGFTAALVTRPMMVLGAVKEHDEFRRYATALGAAQLGSAAALAALAFGAVGVMSFTSASAGLQGAFLGMAAALFFVQGQHFCRMILFTRLKPGRVLANDVVCCTIRLGGLAALVWMDSRLPEADGGWLSGQNVFLLMAGAGLVGSAVGLWQVKEYLGRSLAGAREYLRENWGFGKWLLGSGLGNEVLLRGNNFIVAGFVGVAGAAVLEAPRLLLAPLNVVQFGFTNVVTPRASQQHHNGNRKTLARFLTAAGMVLAGLFVTYVALLAAAPTYWLTLAYTDKYQSSVSALLLWSATYLSVGLRTPFGISLQVMRRTDLLMYVRLGAAIFLLPVSAFAACAYDVQGVIIARLLAETSLLLICAVLSIALLGRKSDANKATDEDIHIE